MSPRLLMSPRPRTGRGCSLLSERHVLLSDFRALASSTVSMSTVAPTTRSLSKIVSWSQSRSESSAPLASMHALRVHEGSLCFTTTGQNIFAKIPVNADGTPSGTASSIIAHTPASTDDFDGSTFGAHGAVYLGTGSGNTLVRVSLSGGPAEWVAGQRNSLTLAEPTNCAFGRWATDQGVLYVATAGGYCGARAGPFQLVGGALMVLDVETAS